MSFCTLTLMFASRSTPSSTKQNLQFSDPVSFKEFKSQNAMAKGDYGMRPFTRHNFKNSVVHIRCEYFLSNVTDNLNS